MNNQLPWQSPIFNGWSICGMNHYQQGGEQCLFVSMTNNGTCITANGKDDDVLWDRLQHKAEKTYLIPKNITDNSIYNIQKIVATYFKVTVDLMVSRQRTRSIILPRHFAMALSVELTNCSLPEIGDMFCRDHTTVIHAMKNVDKCRRRSPDIDNDYKILRLQVETNPWPRPNSVGPVNVQLIAGGVIS